jgi:hypothetical protein
LIACQAIHPDFNNTSFLELKLETMLKLSFNDLVQVYKGKELAQKIDERRIGSLRM